MSTCQVAASDLWTLTLCTVRYAMGRTSSVVSDACSLARHFGGAFEPWQTAQIAREVAETLRMRESLGKTLGWQCDHDEWAALVVHLTGKSHREDAAF